MSGPYSPLVWPRAIALLDLNAFFASIEQRDFPELQGRPIAVTNGMTGTCCITSSYEAFLDLTACQNAFGSPVGMARRAKKRVQEVSGLLCSVGVSGDKTTAKFAAKRVKPDGFTVIPPWEARERLQNIPLTELCGIKAGIGNFLAARGIVKCGDMQRLPISVLAQRFGNPGRRIWLMAQGLDPDPIHTTVAPPKTIAHGKIMPPNTRDRAVINTYLLHMAFKVGVRLRKHHYQAQTFAIGLVSALGYIGDKFKTIHPTDDGHEIFALCKTFLVRYWSGWGTYQVHIVALDPRPANTQEDMFLQRDERGTRRNAVMDQINAKYGGEFVCAPATLLNRSTMPNVISPAWKPTGHRQTI